MKTFNTSTRTSLTIAGILTAIICSLVLLKGAPSVGFEASAPVQAETSKVVTADLFTTVKGVVKVSGLMSIK